MKTEYIHCEFRRPVRALATYSGHSLYHDLRPFPWVHSLGLGMATSRLRHHRGSPHPYPDFCVGLESHRRYHCPSVAPRGPCLLRVRLFRPLGGRVWTNGGMQRDLFYHAYAHHHDRYRRSWNKKYHRTVCYLFSVPWLMV